MCCAYKKPTDNKKKKQINKPQTKRPKICGMRLVVERLHSKYGTNTFVKLD